MRIGAASHSVNMWDIAWLFLKTALHNGRRAFSMCWPHLTKWALQEPLQEVDGAMRQATSRLEKYDAAKESRRPTNETQHCLATYRYGNSHALKPTNGSMVSDKGRLSKGSREISSRRCISSEHGFYPAEKLRSLTACPDQAFEEVQVVHAPAGRRS